jgi:hypothetical protein
MSAADFDRYVSEHGVPDDELPQAFADWLRESTGHEHPMRAVGDEAPETSTPPEHPVFAALERVIRKHRRAAG